MRQKLAHPALFTTIAKRLRNLPALLRFARSAIRLLHSTEPADRQFSGSRKSVSRFVADATITPWANTGLSTPMDRHRIINESPRTNIRAARPGLDIPMSGTVAPAVTVRRVCICRPAGNGFIRFNPSKTLPCRARLSVAALPRTGATGRSYHPSTETWLPASNSCGYFGGKSRNHRRGYNRTAVLHFGGFSGFGSS